jgi:hypothetical protein
MAWSADSAQRVEIADQIQSAVRPPTAASEGPLGRAGQAIETASPQIRRTSASVPHHASS